MTQMVTRCPKCATAFRITSTQLESAKGAVRCGSCLHIFKAQDYLVKNSASEAPAQTKVEPLKPEPTKAAATKAEIPKSGMSRPELAQLQAPKPSPVIAKQPALAATPKPVAAKPTTPPPQVIPVKPVIVPISVPQKAVASVPQKAVASAPEKAVVPAKAVIDKAKVLEDEEDILISDDMDSTNEKASTYEFDGFIDIDMHPKQTVSLFEREIRYEAPREGDEETTDESWAEELMDDDEEVFHQLKKPAPLIVKTPVAAQPDQVDATIKNSSESSTSYSGPVFSLVNENTDEHKEEPFFSEAFLNATRAPDAAPVESSAFAAALFEQDVDNDEAEKPASKRPVKSSSKMRAFDTSRAALLMNIMPAPVEFTARRMRRWYQKKLWPTLAIIMGALFFFQIAYFKFDYFSRVEPYRTAYLFICPVLGCEVPSLVDTSKILATNLIVRNHPDIGSALMVDAILINNAPFEQPFPDLILSFSKLDETPVATRRFTAKEYLGGELAGMRYIPERQPVHITLEISDPGPDAVNYTLATH